MSSSNRLSRQQLLTTAGVVVGATAIGATGFANMAQAVPSRLTWTGAISQNGWPMVDGATLKRRRIE